DRPTRGIDRDRVRPRLEPADAAPREELGDSREALPQPRPVAERGAVRRSRGTAPCEVAHHRPLELTAGCLRDGLVFRDNLTPARPAAHLGAADVTGLLGAGTAFRAAAAGCELIRRRLALRRPPAPLPRARGRAAPVSRPALSAASPPRGPPPPRSPPAPPPPPPRPPAASPSTFCLLGRPLSPSAPAATPTAAALCLLPRPRLLAL